MAILSESIKHIIPADIIEEEVTQDLQTGTIVTTIYTGIFQKGKNETSPDGCIIKKIHITDELGVKRTTVKYAEGNDNSFLHSWADKENYIYRYSIK
jgi:hypothetical protein